MRATVALSLMLVSGLAYPQIENLNYEGGPLTGTETITQDGITTTEPITGTIQGSLDIDPLPLFGTTTIHGGDGAFYTPVDEFDLGRASDFFTFTTVNGQIVAWLGEISYGINVDTVYFQSGPGVTESGVDVPNFGGQLITASASGPAGTWTVQNYNEIYPAPEIDPTVAGSGLMLLLGGLAVVRGRRLQ